ncbi:MAG: hypothetical protein A2Y14_02060 [Verrucomicrobia bacterium GWF2_51_19]|nr:MAG: hypothetical protein A2Y14_02060 [Verrucomicrobia bacterium GWF2_51_19]HCJ12047.1 hypothetical protein [Opitutae bacterium]
MDSFLKNRGKGNVFVAKKLSLSASKQTPAGLRPLSEKTLKISTPAALGQDTPAIQVVTENDIVKKILIDCTCGKHIELQCEYKDKDMYR